MTAVETLRRAATEMRRDTYNGQTEDAPFLDAVADWLLGHAGDLDMAGGHLASCDSPGDVEQAIVIARAYLGEAS